MLKITVLLAAIAACSAHLVHGPVIAPVVAPTPYLHGYSSHGLLGYGGYGYGGHGYGGHGYGGHGYGGHGYGDHDWLGYGYVKPVGHHILKRSPHYAAPIGHLGAVGHLAGAGHLGLGHVAPVAVVAPAAVSHQSRVDIRHTPAIVAAPVYHAGSLTYGSSYYGSGHYGIGHYGSAYPHLGHY